MQDSCAPGTPSGNDATCNGIDEDCDGTTDEDCAGEVCDNDLDDDGDDYADCLDPDCVADEACEDTVPDPGALAPAADLTHFARLYELTEFLFNGATPVQLDVAANAIVPDRIGIVRGRVLDTAGNPLQGVTVSVSDHPEFGYTRSRADGRYDLAVNGGRDYRLTFRFAGCPTVERSFEVEWERFAIVQDVVMTPFDTAATVVDVASPTGMQVARGSVRTDADGSRQATLLFPSGLTANLVMPSGMMEPLTSMTVRATEYSVGALGEQAMPAALPPQVAYVFAAEFSVDEALSAGAKSVQFSAPVLAYLENFLDIPVGSAVPAGFYDRGRGAWTALESGVVIAVTAITSGLAELDTDGDALADSELLLAALGITSEERAALANLYAPGQTLWRVPVPHFSAVSAGFLPGRSSGGATNPFVPPLLNRLQDDVLDRPSVDKRGSALRIHIENASISHDVPIAGTPFKLNYSSGRAREAVSRGLRFQIPVGLEEPPEDPPTRIDVTVLVAGQELKQSVPAETLVVEIPWDGLNAFGQQVTGAATAAIQVCYVFDAVYFTPPPAWNVDFGDVMPGEPGSPEVETLRYELSSCTSYREQLTPYLSNALGPDGWMLSVQDSFDPDGRREIRGNGQQLSAQGRALGYSFTDVEGPFQSEFGFGSLGLRGFVPLWNGGFLLFRPLPTQPYYTTPQGVITVGDLTNYWSSQTWLLGTPALFPAPGGGVYVHERTSTRNEVLLYRLDADNRIVQPGQVIATNFVPQATGSDGRLYGVTVPDVLQVTPDGTANPTPDVIHTSTTWASGTNAVPIGDNPAGTLNAFEWLTTAGDDGTVYLLEQWRKIAPESGTVFGRLLAIAPTGGTVELLSHAAYEAADPDTDDTDGFGVTALTVDPATRTPVIAVGLRAKMFSVRNGALVRISGRDFSSPFPTTNTDASMAWSVEHMHYGGDGLLYFIESRAGTSTNKLRRVEPSFGAEPVHGGDFKLPSPDGLQVLRFDETGRHLDTREHGSNDLLYQFTYTDGLLTGITDRYNNFTSIGRLSDGTIAQIVAPFGQTTTIETDALGRITEIIAPDDTAYSFTYHGDTSLLASVTNPRSYTSSFTFDDEGRLLTETDPAGGGRTLDWSESTTEPTITTAEGVDRSYRFVRTDTGLERSVSVEGDVLATITENAEGQLEVTKSDGTTVETLLAADPIWGMARPYTSLRNVRFPSGRTPTITTARSATPLSSSNPFGPASWTETTTINGRTYTKSFNASTRVLRETSPEGRVTTTTMNASGTQLQVTRPGRATQTTIFDARGRPVQITQTDGTTTRSVSHGYDPASGYLQSTTGPIPTETATVTTDAFGRTRSQVRPDGQTHLYGLDDLGLLLSVTPPGKPAHEMTYSPVDLLSAYLAPRPGGGAPVPVVSFAYDLDRNVEQIDGADGQTLEFAYRSDGKLHSISTPYGIQNYLYDPDTNNLSTIFDPGHLLNLTYDGSLLTSIEWQGLVQGIVSFGYDDNNWVTSVLIAGTPVVTFEHDDDGLVTAAPPLTIARAPASGDVTGTTLGLMTTIEATNLFGESDGYTASFNGSTLFDEQITLRDQAGRIVDKTETVLGVTHAYHYDYDSAGRLTDVTIDGVQSAHYDYDENGNRLARTTSSGSEIGTYDEADQIETYGGLTYHYTPRGDLASVSDGATSTSYEYDPFGNLRQATLPDGRVIAYDIDPLNRRIGKTVDGVPVYGLLYSDALRPLAQLDASNTVVAFFVYATRSNVPDYMVRNDGHSYRFIVDHLGSVRVVVNASDGTVAQRLDYDEFGRVLVDSNPGFQPFGFAGGLYDADTGLVRFGARDYDAVTGRWTAKDPILFAGGDTNLYAYVYQDPVNLIDVTGEDAIYVHYDWYPVETGYGKAPLGHAGVVTVDPATGNTRYYEYGRYESDFGNVRRRSIPDLVMGPDGRPTEASMKNLTDFLSKNLGRGAHVSYRYFDDADHNKVNAYAERFMRDRNRDPYNIFTNMCKTWANDAIQAGR